MGTSGPKIKANVSLDKISDRLTNKTVTIVNSLKEDIKFTYALKKKNKGKKWVEIQVDILLT